MINQGWLKNGNPPGNPHLSPRCDAKSKRTGNPCKAPAMKNGKCRLHGGKSTGPKTEEGKSAIGRFHLKHGMYTKDINKTVLLIRTIKQRVKDEINNV